MPDAVSKQMAEQRALLTETERAILSGERDVKDNYKYSVKSRVRGRIRDRLGDDVDILREHHPEMNRLLEDVVCGETEPRGQATAEAGSEPPRTASQAPGAPHSEVDRDLLRDELAGSGDLLERRVDAIVAMYDVLREQGQAEKSELLDAVDIDATGYASADSVWSNMVKGVDSLRALPGVETPPTGRTTWRYTDA